MRIKVFPKENDYNQRPEFAVSHKGIKMYNSMSVRGVAESQMSGIIKGKNGKEYVFVHIETIDKSASAELYLPSTKVFNKKGNNENVNMLITSYIRMKELALKQARSLQ